MRPILPWGPCTSRVPGIEMAEMAELPAPTYHLVPAAGLP